MRTGETAWELVWTFHHVILDGWSLLLLLREVFAVYAELCQGRQPAVVRSWAEVAERTCPLTNPRGARGVADSGHRDDDRVRDQPPSAQVLHPGARHDGHGGDRAVATGFGVAAARSSNPNTAVTMPLSSSGILMSPLRARNTQPV